MLTIYRMSVLNFHGYGESAIIWIDSYAYIGAILAHIYSLKLSIG